MALFLGIKQLDTDGFLLLVPVVGPVGHQVDDDCGSDHWLRKVCLKCRRPRRLSHAARHAVVRRPRGRGFEKNLPFRELDYLSWSIVGTGGSETSEQRAWPLRSETVFILALFFSSCVMPRDD